jgi:hypothetical protein
VSGCDDVVQISWMTTPDIQSKHGMTTGLKKILHLCEGNMSSISKKPATSSVQKRKKPATSSVQKRKKPAAASSDQTVTGRAKKKQKTT